ncbi:hypothetical protein Peur_042642 [Populus x canadensis]
MHKSSLLSASINSLKERVLEDAYYRFKHCYQPKATSVLIFLLAWVPVMISCFNGGTLLLLGWKLPAFVISAGFSFSIVPERERS